MSSAANHRARSHRSQKLHGSAMQGERRDIIRQAALRTGAQGTPLIFRLQAARRRIMEIRKRKETEHDAG